MIFPFNQKLQPLPNRTEFPLLRTTVEYRLTVKPAEYIDCDSLPPTLTDTDWHGQRMHVTDKFAT